MHIFSDIDPSLVQAPRRFRSISVDPQLPQQPGQRERSQHTIGLPPVKPRHNIRVDHRGECSSHRSPSNRTAQASQVPSGDLQHATDVRTDLRDTQKSASIKTQISSSDRTKSVPTTQQAPSALSLMGLINEAARKAELEEVASAQRRVALLTARQTTGNPPPAAQTSSTSTCSPNGVPRSPAYVKASQCDHDQQITPASGVHQGTMPAACGEQPQLSTTAATVAPPALNSSSKPHCLDQEPQKQQHQQLQHQCVLQQSLDHNSDCGSDGSCTPPAASLSSCANSSSLNSTASFLSTTSSNSSSDFLKPKSILLTRTSIGSSCSSGSSFTKRVTWKDGQSDEESAGQDLVTVRVLEDSPDVRKVRKDTWPERPGARRDLLDQQAAAAAAEAKQQQQQQQQQHTGLVGKLLQEPNKLRDWREKLKQLQADRRQQRLVQVHAVWEQQQRKLAKQEAEGLEEEEQQQPLDVGRHGADQQPIPLKQQEQQAVAMDVDVAAAVVVSNVKGGSSSVNVAAASAPCGIIININAVAAATPIQAAI